MRFDAKKTGIRQVIVLAAVTVLLIAFSQIGFKNTGSGGGSYPSGSVVITKTTGIPGTLTPDQKMASGQNTDTTQTKAAQAATPINSAASVPQALPLPSPGHAVIAFTFDDGYVSDYNLAYPILKQYGIRGTSYIIGKLPDNDTPNTLSWDQIREMAAYGWDFGCHTYAHSDLPRLSDNKIRQSMEEENEAFLRQGLPAPQIMAYPFGKFNQRVISIICQYRLQARLAFYQNNFVDLNDVNPYELNSISADVQDLAQLKSREALVDKACVQGAVIVFRTHCLYFNRRNDNGKWHVQTTSRLFAQLVQYCVDKGCTFVTMGQLMQMYTK